MSIVGGEGGSMNTFFRRFSRVTFVAGAVVAAAAGVAYATTAITSVDTSVIHACRNTTNGNLRVVDSAADCRTPEAAIAWRSEERRVGKECRSRWWPDH